MAKTTTIKTEAKGNFKASLYDKCMITFRNDSKVLWTKWHLVYEAEGCKYVKALYGQWFTVNEVDGSLVVNVCHNGLGRVYE